MKITLKQIIEINKKLNGDLITDSSLAFAEDSCKYTQSKYKCIALWTRAIAVDHAFSDANKRTTLIVIRHFINIKDPLKMAKTVRKIAEENITNLSKIAELIKNANR